MKGEPRISFRVLVLLLKSRGINQEQGLPVGDSPGASALPAGLEPREGSLGVRPVGEGVSHVAVKSVMGDE